MERGVSFEDSGQAIDETLGLVEDISSSQKFGPGVPWEDIGTERQDCTDIEEFFSPDFFRQGDSGNVVLGSDDNPTSLSLSEITFDQPPLDFHSTSFTSPPSSGGGVQEPGAYMKDRKRWSSDRDSSQRSYSHEFSNVGGFGSPSSGSPSSTHNPLGSPLGGTTPLMECLSLRSPPTGFVSPPFASPGSSHHRLAGPPGGYSGSRRIYTAGGGRVHEGTRKTQGPVMMSKQRRRHSFHGQTGLAMTANSEGATRAVKPFSPPLIPGAAAALVLSPTRSSQAGMVYSPPSMELPQSAFASLEDGVIPRSNRSQEIVQPHSEIYKHGQFVQQQQVIHGFPVASENVVGAAQEDIGSLQDSTMFRTVPEENGGGARHRSSSDSLVRAKHRLFDQIGTRKRRSSHQDTAEGASQKGHSRNSSNSSGTISSPATPSTPPFQAKNSARASSLLHNGADLVTSMAAAENMYSQSRDYSGEYSSVQPGHNPTLLVVNDVPYQAVAQDTAWIMDNVLHKLPPSQGQQRGSPPVFLMPPGTNNRGRSVSSGSSSNTISPGPNAYQGSSPSPPVSPLSLGIDDRGVYAREGWGMDTDGMKTEKDDEDSDSKITKKRLVWTPSLHARFLNAISALEGKAVPKAILSFMNVDGLTRENVASHLQKYRLSKGKQKDQTVPAVHVDVSVESEEPTLKFQEFHGRTGRRKSASKK